MCVYMYVCSMYVYMYVSMYIYIYIYIYAHTHTHTHLHTHTHTHMHTYIDVTTVREGRWGEGNLFGLLAGICMALVLLYMCPRTTICVFVHYYVSSYTTICILVHFYVFVLRQSLWGEGNLSRPPLRQISPDAFLRLCYGSFKALLRLYQGTHRTYLEIALVLLSAAEPAYY